MSRALRLEYSGALYHVTSRGNRRENIYEDDTDRAVFLELLGEVCRDYNWGCHAYCLMSNHYHLIIETPDANLAKGMRQLNGVYSQKVNRRHKKVGHVFQGRYTSILVEKESYLLELSRYVVLNPVRAGMVNEVADWKWSSYRATAGLELAEFYLNVDWILSHFHVRKKEAVQPYQQFVAAGVEEKSPMVNVQNQIFLGSAKFVERGLDLIDEFKDLSEIPRVQKTKPKRTLEYYAMNSANRNEAIAYAYKTGGYTMKEIGAYFGLGYSMVSRIVGNSQFKT